MEGKDAIIAKIISDAEKKAAENVYIAEEYAATVKEQAKSWAEEYSAAQEKALKTETEEIIARRMIVAGLDVRKNTLKTKQDILDEIYNRAEQKLRELNKKQYLSLILAKIDEYADDGDEVLLSCDGVVSEKDITESEVAKRKKLTVSKKQGKFKGGVILVGKICDKNLTFHEIILAEKEKSSSLLAKKLFG